MSEPGEDRVTAVVAALLGVRTDHASARFDAEIESALTANRLDVQTARALRFWQRASVQAVTDYAAAVLPAVLPVLAATDDANRQGADDIAEAATAWGAAQPAADTTVADAAPPARPEVAIRYVTAQHRPIVVSEHRPTVAPEHRSPKETEQAVRAAFRARATSDQHARREEEEDRDHARTATSA
jgi:hypothetical protein